MVLTMGSTLGVALALADREARLLDPEQSGTCPNRGEVEVLRRARSVRGRGGAGVAYCLLVEDVMGEPVPHGILQFADREVRVPVSNSEGEAERSRWAYDSESNATAPHSSRVRPRLRRADGTASL